MVSTIKMCICIIPNSQLLVFVTFKQLAIYKRRNNFVKKNQHHFMYLCVLIISIFTLFMVGCNKAMSDISVDESNVSSDLSQKSESTNDSRPKTIDGRKEDLRFLRSSNNNLGTYNSEGFYRLITLSEGSSNIVYIDFKNEQLIYLCNQPSCTHSDSSCPSWIGNGLEGGALIADESVLYYFANNGEIYQMNPDGNQKEKIGTRAAGTQLVGDIATDGDNLFWIQSQSNGTVSYSELYVINLSSKEISLLARFEDATTLCATYGRALFLRHDTVDGQTLITQYTVDTQEERTLRSGDSSYEYGASTHDRYVYIDYRDKSVKEYFYKSGELKILQENIPMDGNTPIYLNALVDNHFVFTIHRANGNSPYMIHEYNVVDLTTGEISHLLPTADNMGEETAAEIAAITEDKYLVRYKIVDTTYHILMNDGTTSIQQGPLAHYAFIDKDDYWNGNPNYSVVNINIKV